MPTAVAPRIAHRRGAIVRQIGAPLHRVLRREG
jgi:hypothetical protein